MKDVEVGGPLKSMSGGKSVEVSAAFNFEYPCFENDRVKTC